MYGDPAVVDVNARTKDVDSLEDASILLQNQADQRHGLADFDGPRKMPVRGTKGVTGSEACLLVYSVVGKSLIFPIRPFALLPKFEDGKPASESGGNPVASAGLAGAILLPAQD